MSSTVYNDNDNNFIINNSSDLTHPENVCDYYFPVGLRLKHKEHTDTIKSFPQTINIIALHLESLVHQRTSPYGVEFDIIGFYEKHLNANVCHLYNIENHAASYKKKSTHGGGVALYLHDNMKECYLIMHPFSCLILRLYF